MPSDSDAGTPPIPLGKDGFFHPTSEGQLVDLVKYAAGQPAHLRVRGAVHSVAQAIYSDGTETVPNKPNHQKPPAQNPNMPNIDVMLDGYCGWRILDESKKLVEADAGIHLGPDPNNPNPEARKKENSLLWQLQQRGWAMSDLGGITHQTISGFTATGSSGGSLTYSASDDLYGFRIIDATGKVEEFTREDADPSTFYAMAPNLGVLGVVSTVILQCVDTFNIKGQEAITTVDGCAVDLFGNGTTGRPSLEQHLTETEYTRIEWWPQRGEPTTPGADRVLVWQAARIPAIKGFRPKPYREFGADPDVEEVVFSIALTIIGNLDNLTNAVPQLDRTIKRATTILQHLINRVVKIPIVGDLLADLIKAIAEDGAAKAMKELKKVASILETSMPVVFPLIVNEAIQLDNGQPQRFHDYAWSGLPMDNAADDQLLPTGFTEIWLPLGLTQQVMALLRQYFNPPNDPDLGKAYARTGFYAWEFYAARASKFWLSPAYSDGTDVWKDGAFRIDPYWFEGNAGDPAKDFYPQLWELLRDTKSPQIPFRLHWGKYQPVENEDLPGWVDFFKAQYPKWQDFMDLRNKRDPKGMFLNDYWRQHLGITDSA